MRKLTKELETANDKLSQEEEEKKNLEMVKIRLEKQYRDLEVQYEKTDTNLKGKVRNFFFFSFLYNIYIPKNKSYNTQ